MAEKKGDKKSSRGVPIRKLIGTPQEKDLNKVTSIKTKVRVADVLAQIAVFRDMLQQDVLDLYVQQFEDDLEELIMKRQAELQELKNRPPMPPPPPPHNPS